MSDVSMFAKLKMLAGMVDREVNQVFESGPPEKTQFDQERTFHIVKSIQEDLRSFLQEAIEQRDKMKAVNARYEQMMREAQRSLARIEDEFSSRLENSRNVSVDKIDTWSSGMNKMKETLRDDPAPPQQVPVEETCCWKSTIKASDTKATFAGIATFLTPFKTPMMTTKNGQPQPSETKTLQIGPITPAPMPLSSTKKKLDFDGDCTSELTREFGIKIGVKQTQVTDTPPLPVITSTWKPIK